MTASTVPSHHETSPPVSWFELFFDLVVVAAVNVTNDRYLEHPSSGTALIAILGLISLCWVWFLTTVSNNLFTESGLLRRGLILVQMAALILAALAVDYADPARMGRGLAVYGVALGVSAALLLRGSGDWRPTSLRRPATLTAIAAGVCIIVGVIGPEPLWPYLVGALALSAAPLLIADRSAPTPPFVARPDHMRERLGLIVLIVLGDGFLLLVQALGTKGSIPNLGVFAMTFVMSVSIWALYFEGTFSSRTNVAGMRWRLTLLGHLALLFGMLGTLDCLVLFTAREQDRLGEQTITYFAVCIGVVLVSFSVLGFTARGRWGTASWVQLASGLVLAAAGLAITPETDIPVYSAMIAVGIVVLANAVLAARLDRRSESGGVLPPGSPGAAALSPTG